MTPWLNKELYPLDWTRSFIPVESHSIFWWCCSAQLLWLWGPYYHGWGSPLLHLWNGGKGSNCMAEAMALAGLLSFLYLPGHSPDLTLRGFKDSNWPCLGKVLHLLPSSFRLDDRVMFLWEKMDWCSIYHIYRSKNQQADCLSKVGLLFWPGIWSVKVISNGESVLIQDFSFPGFWCSVYEGVLVFFTILLAYV